MHISDGILPLGLTLAADAVALAGVYATGRKVEAQEIPRMGMMATVLFGVSLVHLPLGGTSTHLGLFGLAGMLLGRRAFPVVLVSLLFQSLIFQHGGLLSLGVNALSMGGGALLSWLLWDFLPLEKRVKSFLCGFLGIAFPALFVALIFQFLHYGKGMLLLLAVSLPVAAVEAGLTLLIYQFFQKVQPGVWRK